MGLFDFLKKKTEPGSEQRTETPAPPALGWEAIEAEFMRLYPGQTNPAHVAPLVHRMDDISENAAAFDGISAYDGGAFWHFVSFGLTELHVKQSDSPEWSGFGYELTFRLAKNDDSPPAWAFEFMEAIGKAVWKDQVFAAGHTIKTGPINGDPETKQNAVLVVRDPAIPEPIDTPHGRVEFLLLVGVPDEFRQQVLQGTVEASVVAEQATGSSELVTRIET